MKISRLGEAPDYRFSLANDFRKRKPGNHKRGKNS